MWSPTTHNNASTLEGSAGRHWSMLELIHKPVHCGLLRGKIGKALLEQHITMTQELLFCSENGEMMWTLKDLSLTNKVF